MSQGQQQASSTVLVFEPDPSLRRLIALGLLHRGLHVVEADSLITLEEVATEQTVDLLVVDVDDTVTSNWELLEVVRAQPRFSSVATIALSWEIPAARDNTIPASRRVPTSFLPKPFDARILHETIDEFVATRVREQRAREAQMEAALLATYSHHTAPSAWPFITAAGLFFLVVGLLLQPALAIVGGLVVVASLLLWTLGGPPAGTKMALSVSQQ